MLRRLAVCLAIASTTLIAQGQPPLDKAARAWVDATLKKLTLEQLVGQMIFAPFNATYLSSDTDEYDALVKLVHETQIGGVIAFGLSLIHISEPTDRTRSRMPSSA